ncbi:uncharacterized protein LAESUDRAFT_644145 [Laetiporus sulphureus 93-53]|uniref:Uncharacterized protein n=1 Tax=Laetiporus sulphureus 93-53 TaxID=1314785 RepID=A0A165GQJ4_9APHY|nr:uncharacterized protein LAESUDRAFT_644145 [Laetiporus sulphureus 93-53]KZT10668.1 hypothetical protein LAESUDRAFT_644145 [Laetiporus sulphureus 93-53]
MPAVSIVVDAETPKQSEQAELHGHRALTPMISGTVTGGIIGLMWIVGLLLHFYRRWRGHQAVRSAGLRNHRELDILPPKPEVYIIPPDPAIIEGKCAPGERVIFDDPKADADGAPRHVKTVPFAQTEKTRKQKAMEVSEALNSTELRIVSAPQMQTMADEPSPIARGPPVHPFAP